MKALILNSGLGHRMGVLTSEHPKCMTEISAHETILSRQLKLLSDAGVAEVVMTTSMYHLPHGHAVAVCLPHVWRYMNKHIDKCIDARGAKHLAGTLKDISNEMGCGSSAEAVETFEQLLRSLDIQNPQRQLDTDIDTLTASVNPVRLKNNPVGLDTETLRLMYEAIVR